MHIKFLCIVIIKLLIHNTISAQLDPVMNLTDHTNFYWNPSLNALNNQMIAGATVWNGASGLANEDRSILAYIQYPLVYKNSTVGLSFLKDTYGSLDNNKLNIIYSYNLNINKNKYINIGLMPSIRFYSYNANRILAQNIADPNLVPTIDNAIRANLSIGVNYFNQFGTLRKKNNLYFGLSYTLPISKELDFNDDISVYDINSLFGHVGLIYSINNDLKSNTVIRFQSSILGNQKNRKTLYTSLLSSLTIGEKFKAGVIINNSVQVGLLLGYVLKGSILKDGHLHIDMYGLTNPFNSPIQGSYNIGASVSYYFDLSRYY